MIEAQRDDTRLVFAGIGNAGLLDFVAAWYVKAAGYLNGATTSLGAAAIAGCPPGAHEPSVPKSRPTGTPHSPQVARDAEANGEGEQRREAIGGQIPISGTNLFQVRSVTTNLGSDPQLPASHLPVHPLPFRCAFVSINSITQGEQVGVLWGWMLAQGVHIQFAHRTFSWSNEARSKAAVHCVIVGFGLEDRPGKVIYEYDDIKREPHAVSAININPYLVDASDVVLPRRSSPICAVPEIGIGNKPIDDGNYLFTTEERDAFIATEPASAKWFRRWLGADEFLNGYERWCL